MAPHSTQRVKPRKPSEHFPLFPHNNGSWAKKIRGKLHYFGPWDQPEEALENFEAQRDALYAGRTPGRMEADREGTRIKQVLNRFMNDKEAAVIAGEITKRTMAEYETARAVIASAFGNRLVSDLCPEDFTALRRQMATRWGPERLSNMIQYVRSIFKHAYDSDLINRPVRFGPTFKKPSMKVLRQHRAARGKKLFSPDEIVTLVNAAGVQLRAMILLGINCGFGNGDCAALPIAAVDLGKAWIHFARPKTGIDRRCPLWPETVAALKAWLATRRVPKDESVRALVFVTKYGKGWGKDIPSSPISAEMRKLLTELKIAGRRNFYALRHTFRTVGDSSKDQAACDFLMGHARNDMASLYREEIEDARLQAVVDHVRAWLNKSEKKLLPTLSA